MSDVSPQSEAKKQGSKRALLPAGRALSCVEANEITHARETSLVVVVGSPDSGKTTMLASLLHCFQRGPFAGHGFAGSQTLVGFDQRCHLGRTRSRLPAPDTPRTNVGDPNRILHLRLRTSQSELRDVLLTDISGEEYEDLRHSVDACQDFELFTRADYVVLVVDGQRLADNGERHAAKIEAFSMLRCMSDAGKLTQDTWLDVLIAKCDLMTTSGAHSFADQLVSEVQTRYEGQLANLRCHKIAARPNIETQDFPLGYGLDLVFPAWLHRRVRSIDLGLRHRMQATHSEMDRFLERYCPELLVEPMS